MLSISHAATGAFIASHVDNPLIAVPLILISHYALDAVPHWDAGTGLGNGSKTPKKAFLLEIPDLLLALVLVVIMYPSLFNLNFAIFTFSPLWGAFFGLLPDFLEAPRNFFKYEPPILRPINRFHHSFHHSIPNIISGLAPQLLLMWLLFTFR